MKRFTETVKWQDAWFRKLSPKHKCLWQYLVDNCDAAGVIEPDWELASFQIGDEVTESDLSIFGGRIDKLANGKLWIRQFINFQYGKLSEDCRAHGPVFKAIQLHQLDRVLEGYAMGSNTHIDKDKDKDKIEGGVGEDSASSKKPKREPATHAQVPECLASVEGFPAEWSAFCAHRRKKRAPMTARAEELLLETLSKRPAESVIGLQAAMKAGWTGFEWDWFDKRCGKQSGAPSGATGKPASAASKWADMLTVPGEEAA